MSVSVAAFFGYRWLVFRGLQLAISKPDMIKLDVAQAGGGTRLFRRGDLNRRIQQLEDALAGRHGPLQNVVFVAQVLNGTEEALRILHKSHKHADGHSAAQHAE